MKHKVLYLAILLSLPSMAIAQLVANAGPDREICSGPWGTDYTRIGGNPSARGGTPPYIYRWHTSRKIHTEVSIIDYPASAMLDDTTSANPLVVNSLDSLTLVLEVTDASGATAFDEVHLTFSNFKTQPGYYSFSLAKGDSIFLDYGSNISGGIPPYTFAWNSTNGKESQSDMSFWVKPGSSTGYYLTVIDAGGCSMQGQPMYYVHVTDPNSQVAGESNVTIFPSPEKNLTSVSVNTNLSGKLLYEFFDSNGRLVFKNLTNDKSIRINNDTFQKGMNVYKITAGNDVIAYGKFIVE